MSSHTPGPWELHQNIHGVNSVRVCAASIERGCRPVAEAEILGMSRLEAEANARVIAAAPELLAAASRAVSVLGGLRDAGALPIDGEPVYLALVTAIANAEGRS